MAEKFGKKWGAMGHPHHTLGKKWVNQTQMIMGKKYHHQAIYPYPQDLPRDVRRNAQPFDQDSGSDDMDTLHRKIKQRRMHDASSTQSIY